MQRGLGGTVIEPVQPQRGDREVTLGPFTLALVGIGLFALCSLCFIFGYSVGRRNSDSSTAISVPPPAAPAYTPAAITQSKPSAAQGEAQAQTPPATDTTEPAGADSSGSATATTASPAATQPDASSSESGQPPAQATGGAAVQPALAQSAAIMVQIAAVSHPEDADVLVGALRKRGYAVTSRRDPADGLLHVQVGPFSSRTDAYAMRQKLLNDGYNAIVQP